MRRAHARAHTHTHRLRLGRTRISLQGILTLTHKLTSQNKQSTHPERYTCHTNTHTHTHRVHFFPLSPFSSSPAPTPRCSSWGVTLLLSALEIDRSDSVASNPSAGVADGQAASRFCGVERPAAVDARSATRRARPLRVCRRRREPRE